MISPKPFDKILTSSIPPMRNILGIEMSKQFDKSNYQRVDLSPKRERVLIKCELGVVVISLMKHFHALVEYTRSRVKTSFKLTN